MCADTPNIYPQIAVERCVTIIDKIIIKIIVIDFELLLELLLLLVKVYRLLA